MGIFLLTLINWLLILVETEIKDWEHHTHANQGIETTTGSQDQISIGIMQDLTCNVKLSKVTLVANYFVLMPESRFQNQTNCSNVNLTLGTFI